MHARRSVPRPLLVFTALVAVLLAGPPAGVATATGTTPPAVAAPRAAEPPDVADSRAETSPAPTTSAPGDDTDDSPGLPWPGIIAGGGLGLVAGIVLMVLSKRRENRG